MIEFAVEVDWTVVAGYGFWPMLLVAFGAGIVIGIMVRGSERRSHEEARHDG